MGGRGRVAVGVAVAVMAACGGDGDGSSTSSTTAVEVDVSVTQSTPAPTPRPTTAATTQPGPVATSPSLPSLPTRIGCSEPASVEALAAALSAARDPESVVPPTSMGGLLEQVDIVVRGQVGEIAATTVAGERWLTIEFATVEPIVGEPYLQPDTISIGPLASEQTWAPFIESIRPDGVEAIAFASLRADIMAAGYIADPYGLYLGCGSTAARAAGGDAPFLPPDASLDEIAGLAVDATATLTQGFVPACEEFIGMDGAEPLPDLDQFGPLGAQPNLTLELPVFRDEGELGPGGVAVSLARLPGGVAVEIRNDTSGLGERWQVVVVNDNGSIRWRRCGDEGSSSNGFLVAPAEDDPQALLVPIFQHDGSRGLLALDPTTGHDIETPAIAGRSWLGGVDRFDRFALFGRLDEPRIAVDDDRLGLVDLADGTVAELPYPERANGQEPFRLIWDVVEGDNPGEPVVLQYDAFGAVVGAWVDGAWTVDPDVLARYAPTTFREVFDGEDRGIEALDGTGRRLWFHATAGGLPGEGFHYAQYDDVVLANVCRALSADSGCGDGAFVALDAANGELMWELPGFRPVGTAGDGYAVIGDAFGFTPTTRFEMIDLSTGETIAGQEWLGDAFVNACCGEGEYRWVGREGGVVWAVEVDHVDVYYPAAFSRPTVVVPVGE